MLKQLHGAKAKDNAHDFSGEMSPLAWLGDRL